MFSLAEEFGQIDIYLFDQLLRGRIQPRDRLLEAGCGYGRNLVHFFKQGYGVYGVDLDPVAIESVRVISQRPDNFHVEPVEAMSFPNEFASVVICSAVLHFAKDDAHFKAMLMECWRVLRRDGLFFSRLASSIGIESQIRQVGENRYLLPDGSERYLVNEETLLRWTEALNAKMLDPLKTTLVQNQRSMTTWVLRKS